MAMTNDKIHIIATGGTIDAVFSPKEYKPVPNTKTAIPDFIINYIRPHFEITTSTVAMIDSLYMTDEIRAEILKEIQHVKCKKILITHGTDGMIATAKYLEKNKDLYKNATIVLTGSMIPLIGFSPSDAGFNLGFALSSLQNMPSGIFISMNGQIFEPFNTKKK